MESNFPDSALKENNLNKNAKSNSGALNYKSFTANILKVSVPSRKG